MNRIYKIAMAAACPFPTCQGSQVFIRQLSETLERRGHSIQIVCYHFGEQISGVRVPLCRIPALIPCRKLRAGPSVQKPLLDLLLAARLLQLVRRGQVDIIHAHNYEAAIAAGLVRLATGVPAVFHTHNVMSDELETYFSSRCMRGIARGVARCLDMLTPRMADHVIAISPEIERFFRERPSSPPVAYIPPGIEYEAPPSSGSDNIRTLYGLGTAPLVFYTGNLDGYQNLDLLLESFVRVRQAVPAARLVMLTHCATDEISDRCRTLGIADSTVLVAYEGFTQVQRWLRESRVAVLTRVSWSGFPIKLLNYMAAGVAVVACRGSAKTLVDGVDGLVVPDNDAGAFADAIITALHDEGLCRRLGDNARRKALLEHNWNRIALQVEQVYAQILHGRSCPRR